MCDVSHASSFSGYLRNASASASMSATQVAQHAQALGSSPEPITGRFGSAEEQAYQTLLAATGKEDTTANNESFTEALDEIKQAVYAACFIDGITEWDLPQVVRDLHTAYRDRKIHDLRKAYGSILCLKSKESSYRSQRQTRAIHDIYNRITANYISSLFFVGTYSVGFAIDDTGSIRGQLEAVKCLVRAIIKSTGTKTAEYILGTFNDPGMYSHDYTSNAVWRAGQ